MSAADPSTDLREIRTQVDAAVSAEVDRCARQLTDISADLEPIAQTLVEFCAGGKRIRPLFAYAGWLAARQPGKDGGVASAAEVIRAVGALELVQAAALIHDDIIDASDSRRGKPSVHRRFEAAHATDGLQADAAAFGVSAAILIGDLALIWADAALANAGLPSATLLSVRDEYDLMRVEVMAGQYLDVLQQVRPAPPDESLRTAIRIAELKSASYTVARPMRIGAAIAGAPGEVTAAYAQFGHHVGVAFQLRDDLLGVFGDPAVTGKPAGDDLREGKRTALIARVLAHLGDDTDRLDRFGAADLTATEVDQLRTIITETGAVQDIETMIDDHMSQAAQVLDAVPLDPQGRAVIDALARSAVSRSH